MRVKSLIPLLVLFLFIRPEQMGAVGLLPINEKTLVVSEQNNEPTYSDGWNQGYKDGWCYGRGYGCYPAYPPYPPYPRYGEDSYKGGYNRGFLQGIADHKSKDPN